VRPRTEVPRPVSWLFALCALLLCPAAFADSTPDPIRLSRADGSELVLQSPARRLVTLSPHLTELVYAAGAGHLLAATVAYSDYPPEAADLPRVGDAFRVDTERVHLLKPDLILAWESGNPPGALAHLSDLGFAVWTMEILEPGAIADAVDDIGRAAGTEKLAGPAAESLRRTIDQLEKRYAGAAPVPFFYHVAAQPLYTVIGAHLISRGLALCGGENLFAGLTGLAPQIGIEAVVLADPLALIAPDIAGQPDPLAHWKSWPRLQAVQGDHFILLPADSISRATPRFLNAVELACRMLDDLRVPGDTS
jgi:iron complex transport system substrate-binding protein